MAAVCPMAGPDGKSKGLPVSFLARPVIDIKSTSSKAYLSQKSSPNRQNGISKACPGCLESAVNIKSATASLINVIDNGSGIRHRPRRQACSNPLPRHWLARRICGCPTAARQHRLHPFRLKRIPTSASAPPRAGNTTNDK